MATTQCTRWMWWEWWSEKMTKQSCFFIQVVFPVCLLVCLSLTHARTYTHTFMYMRVCAHTRAHARVHAHMHTYVYANDRGILIFFLHFLPCSLTHSVIAPQVSILRHKRITNTGNVSWCWFIHHHNHTHLTTVQLCQYY